MAFFGGGIYKGQKKDYRHKAESLVTEKNKKSALSTGCKQRVDGERYNYSLSFKHYNKSRFLCQCFKGYIFVLFWLKLTFFNIF